MSWLHQHGVLTTGQIAAAFFNSPDTAADRLAKLRRLGMIDRFRPNRPGGGVNPWHWVLGPLGARMSALAAAETPPTPAATRRRQDRWVAHPHLNHLIGVNQFFIDLHAHARRTPGTAMRRWWSGPDTTRSYRGYIHPDGHGVWTGGQDATVGFFLEFDTGTESLDVLLGKLTAYTRLRRAGGPGFPILFSLHSAAREQNLHRRLASQLPPGVPVATAVRDHPHPDGPAGPVWHVSGNGGQRLPLAKLPCDPGQPGPFNPGLDVFTP